MTGNAHCGSRAGGLGSCAGFTCEWTAIDNRAMNAKNQTATGRIKRLLQKESGIRYQDAGLRIQA
jgi:hypothetical protein